MITKKKKEEEEKEQEERGLTVYVCGWVCVYVGFFKSCRYHHHQQVVLMYIGRLLGYNTTRISIQTKGVLLTPPSNKTRQTTT